MSLLSKTQNPVSFLRGVPTPSWGLVSRPPPRGLYLLFVIGAGPAARAIILDYAAIANSCSFPNTFNRLFTRPADQPRHALNPSVPLSKPVHPRI